MAILVREVPTATHPFAPAGSVVIAVRCSDMPSPYLVAFAPPQISEAQEAAMLAMGLPIPEAQPPLTKAQMAHRAVLRAAGAGVFVGCSCDERYWMRHGQLHEIHTTDCGPSPHSHCQINGHAVERN